MCYVQIRIVLENRLGSQKSAISEREMAVLGPKNVLFPDKHSRELPGSSRGPLSFIQDLGNGTNSGILRTAHISKGLPLLAPFENTILHPQSSATTYSTGASTFGGALESVCSWRISSNQTGRRLSWPLQCDAETWLGCLFHCVVGPRSKVRLLGRYVNGIHFN
jgi:hypothetical protein